VPEVEPPDRAVGLGTSHYLRVHMQIKKIEVKNFRLLKNVELYLEARTTLIVGRNNSGKTSLAELFRRLLLENSANFRLEDFSLGTHAKFWEAFELVGTGKEEPEIRAALPVIEVALTVEYDKAAADLGLLGDFIVDLNPDCVEARIYIRYELEDGKLKSFFDAVGLDGTAGKEQQQIVFFEAMKELVPRHYKCSLVAVDPNDATNRKPLEWSRLKALIQGDLITAHRGLDDTTHKDNDSLGKILSALFATADSESAAEGDRKTVAELKAAVKEVQGSIDKSFNGQLANLLPAFSLFGYRLPDPKLRTETQLDVELLLKNHTRIRYSGVNGVHLPEAYNGLGARNLIFILLKLFEAFKSFKAKPTSPAVHIVFIEEPEAHLHPQMQEVFIQKLSEIAQVFANISGGGQPWPVQFVVSTHSSHMANKASFDAIRYFLSAADPVAANSFSSKIKDLKRDFGDKADADNAFLHQYMSQTRCDLLFADKVILIEGTTERLLLPKLTEKNDAGLPANTRLGSQYVAVLEVGGAYAHVFFKLLDFLELHALIVTDLDTVNAANDGKACKASDGTGTSNACIKAWFGKGGTVPKYLLEKKPEEKISGIRRIAYQVPEKDGQPCGRSFEDAFMLANAAKFAIDGADPEQSAWDAASGLKKSAFALKYAIEDADWAVPRYIAEGLAWLAGVGMAPEAGPVEVTIEVAIPEEAALGK
jgi:putative ATP-dependent endonuclease of OLD family